MEHLHQPRGDAREITDQQLQLSDPSVDTSEAPPRPPVTFAEAEVHNPYAVLVELHDHALSRTAEAPATFHLTELALSAAAVAWWSRWQPISMHRALVAGANLTDVAKAIGTTEADAYQRWSDWADAQAELIINGRQGVDPAEVTAVRERLDRYPRP
jgi:hypothetical protein